MIGLRKVFLAVFISAITAIVTSSIFVFKVCELEYMSRGEAAFYFLGGPIIVGLVAYLTFLVSCYFLNKTPGE